MPPVAHPVDDLRGHTGDERVGRHVLVTKAPAATIAELFGAHAPGARVNAKAAGADDLTMTDARCHIRDTAMLRLRFDRRPGRP